MRGIKMPAKNMSFWVAIILSAAAGFSVLLVLFQLYLPIQVVVPVKDIKAGTVIGQADLGLSTMTRRDKHPNSITDPKLAIGKYAIENLYVKEPILTQKLTSDPKGGAKAGKIAPDETYITLKANEAKWPSDLKIGDNVTVLGVGELGPQVLGEKIKIIDIAGVNQSTGQIGNLKNVVTGDNSGITLVFKWTQVGPFFNGRAMSKEVWLAPEHPDKQMGVRIYEQAILDQISEQALEKNKKN